MSNCGSVVVLVALVVVLLLEKASALTLVPGTIRFVDVSKPTGPNGAYCVGQKITYTLEFVDMPWKDDALGETWVNAEFQGFVPGTSMRGYITSAKCDGADSLRTFILDKKKVASFTLDKIVAGHSFLIRPYVYYKSEEGATSIFNNAVVSNTFNAVECK